MTAARGGAHRFTHAIMRAPGASAVRGLRAVDRGDPDVSALRAEHAAVAAALRSAGLETTILPPLEAFPDALFVEDPALCTPRRAITLRPGAASRAGEPETLRAALVALYGPAVADLPGPGTVDGGDVLATCSETFIGLSDRTDRAGAEALAALLAEDGGSPRIVQTPPGVLHFKSDCALVGDGVILATPRLAASGVFAGYATLLTAAGEEAAANAIRVNDVVLMSAGHPQTQARLEAEGLTVVALDTTEIAKLDGGLSCLSLRAAPPTPSA